ncbi:MAG: ABC transporter substrate-binding protein [Burkholderiaceae bacterium]
MNQRPTLRRPIGVLAVALTGLFFASTSHAELNIGASLSLTGPGSALGVPIRQGLETWPTEIAGEKINLIILDDGGDPSQATRNARKFVSESNVDCTGGL